MTKHDNVYRKALDDVPAPKGYEKTGEYRIAVRDEWFLALGGYAVQVRVARNVEPRLILRKKVKGE
jgi:hypothetical protein